MGSDYAWRGLHLRIFLNKDSNGEVDKIIDTQKLNRSSMYKLSWLAQNNMCAQNFGKYSLQRLVAMTNTPINLW